MTSPCPAAPSLVPLIVADVFQLAGEFRRSGETIAQRVGQTQARWQVLSAASADPRTVPDIARRLGVSRQAVQRLADALVRDGSASFKANPERRSSPHLVLTAKGRGDLAHLTAAAERFHTTVATHVGPTDLAVLHHGLRAMTDALDRLDTAPHKEFAG